MNVTSIATTQLAAIPVTAHQLGQAIDFTVMAPLVKVSHIIFMIASNSCQTHPILVELFNVALSPKSFEISRAAMGTRLSCLRILARSSNSLITKPVYDKSLQISTNVLKILMVVLRYVQIRRVAISAPVRLDMI